MKNKLTILAMAITILLFSNILVAQPTVAAPTPTQDAADVISIFSDAYTPISDVNLNPNWGQATVVTQESIQGNNTLVYTGLNYQGIDFDANHQDVSGMDYVHVDYWTANSSALNISLISPGPNEIPYALTVPTNGNWESVDIPLSSFVPPVDLSDLFQFKFDGNGDIYIDNLYIYKESGGSAVSVTFELDMSIQAAAGTFDPAADTVSVNGTFNGWTAAQDLLTDGDGDLVYTGDISVTAGDTLQFKFWASGIEGQWESVDNRVLVVPASDTTASYFWNDVSEFLQDLSITFQCNMEYEIVSGRFNPESDTLTVRGGMNGWGNTDLMEPNALNPNTYEITKTYQVAAGAEVGYKFAYMTSEGVTGWEGGDNRNFTPTQADIDAGFLVETRTFNDATAADLTGQETTITFTVDMTGAVDGNLGTPFAQIDNVIIAGANPPLNWPSGGWPTTDENLIHFLNDGGTDGDATAGDGIWSVNLVFPKYSLLSVEYKYGANWGTANNGGANDNEGGVGDNHWIEMTPDLVSATVKNEFGVMATSENPHPLVDIVTGVEQDGKEIPLTFALDQNYPNPFNPSTTIKFAIPQQSNVTLKVYNMIGQEVATLVNEQMGAGSYNVDFDASQLSSGIYFYSIQAGQFNVTKKMMLIK